MFYVIKKLKLETNMADVTSRRLRRFKYNIFIHEHWIYDAE